MSLAVLDVALRAATVALLLALAASLSRDFRNVVASRLAVAFALGGGGQGEADPAGANPLAAAPRGRLASLWLRPRWCAAARSPRECQPMAASVHPGELRRKLWLCRPGTMRLAVVASFCPAGPFTTIYQDLRDFTRAGARANVNNSTG